MDMIGTKKTACVFAHYDRSGEIEGYVLFYLRALRECTEHVVIVTTSPLSENSKSKLHDLQVQLVERDNTGYDFFSYQVGVNTLDLNRFDELVLCNDSVYGPFRELGPILDDMRVADCDFWGMTESYDVAHHLQSYFLVFNKEVIHSKAFRAFWERLEILNDKREIIEKYEVGLSQALLAAGFRFIAVASFEDQKQFNRIIQSWRAYVNTVLRKWNNPQFWRTVYRVIFHGAKLGVNPTHTEWKSMLANHGVPFLKTALLRDNPTGMNNLHEVDEVISSLGDYPVELIYQHRSRCRSDERI
ncbi:MAG: rhamnan synthesis F family protein [Halioglobus sp.]|nr:rhamnan synthesis F family protein [Halioglobus sp.]